MLNLRRVPQLSVFLENRAGQLALLCSCLSDAGIRVTAVSVADTIEHGLVRCVVDDPDAACAALEANGFNCLRAQVLAVELSEAFDSLASLAERLGSAGINIQYLYGSRPPSEGRSVLIVRVLDLDAAEQTLRADLA